MFIIPDLFAKLAVLHPINLTFILISAIHTHPVSRSSHFDVFRLQFWMHFSFPTCMLHVLSIPSFYYMKSANYEGLHYAWFPLLHYFTSSRSKYTVQKFVCRWISVCIHSLIQGTNWYDMNNCYTRLRPLSKNYKVLKAGFCFRYQVKKRGRETGNSSVAPPGWASLRPEVLSPSPFLTENESRIELSKTCNFII